MTPDQRIAQRETYWSAQMDLLAKRAARGPLPDDPEHILHKWDQMERRLMAENARLWREACGHFDEVEKAA